MHKYRYIALNVGIALLKQTILAPSISLVHNASGWMLIYCDLERSKIALASYGLPSVT